MMRSQSGSRWLAGILSFAIFVGFVGFTGHASANGIEPVFDGGGGGGGCATNCPQPQSSYVMGTAISGSASNENNGSNYQLDYGIPYDPGNDFSGTYMIQIVDTNNNVSVYSGPIADAGHGGTGYFSYGGLPAIPVGGSASITINESAPNGSGFQAGYVVNNYGK